MNPDTNKFETLFVSDKEEKSQDPNQMIIDAINNPPGRSILVRPNGEPVPSHWSIFKVGEEVTINNYTFKVAYIEESALLLEPVGLVTIGERKIK